MLRACLVRVWMVVLSVVPWLLFRVVVSRLLRILCVVVLVGLGLDSGGFLVDWCGCCYCCGFCLECVGFVWGVRVA